MREVINCIRSELKSTADEKTLQSARRFFKERVTVYGVKTSIVHKISQKYWCEAKNLSKAEVFGLCEDLLRSDYMEEAFIVSDWLPNLSDEFEKEDLATFKIWIERYINNWAKCDSLCNHTVGDFIEKFPECVGEIISWTKSGNRWLRRASAVSLILPARRGRFLTEVFQISDALLCDSEDLVQKGYGWLLKEASRLHQREVFNYVIQHRKSMPRTALRYAVELLPKDLKAETMKKA
jgi:3-methyladenine DNA glycosylase AlkD